MTLSVRVCTSAGLKHLFQPYSSNLDHADDFAFLVSNGRNLQNDNSDNNICSSNF